MNKMPEALSSVYDDAIASTDSLKAAAAKAGVCESTIWRHRKRRRELRLIEFPADPEPPTPESVFAMVRALRDSQVETLRRHLVELVGMWEDVARGEAMRRAANAPRGKPGH